MGQPALRNQFLTEEEYFSGEELTEEPHEYIDGAVYAMSVPTDTHGVIQQNLGSTLHQHLRGKKCRAWMGNMRVRIGFPKVVHYIPDVLVACDDPPRDPRFREEPLAIFEVLSESTKAIDLREKRFAYTTLPTLRHYFVVRQDRVEITLFRRAGAGWEEFVFTERDQELEIPELGFRIPVTEVYAATGL
jgi:Uma2 family endonuclease